MKTKINLMIVSGLLFALPASAHVVVKPSTAGVGAFQSFDMGVPSEKPLPTVSVRLMIPSGLEYVTPNVKQGWKVSAVKSADGNTTTEIDWIAGSVPAGERDDFLFSAKVPGSAQELDWKAYQTYADGSVVSWDVDPAQASASDFSSSGPYSVTKVVDDLAPASPSRYSDLPMILSVVALVFSVAALRQSKKAAGSPNV